MIQKVHDDGCCLSGAKSSLRPPQRQKLGQSRRLGSDSGSAGSAPVLLILAALVRLLPLSHTAVFFDNPPGALFPRSCTSLCECFLVQDRLCVCSFSSLAAMTSQSGVALQDISFPTSPTTPASSYYPMASTSYSPRDLGVSTSDLGLFTQQFGHQPLHDPSAAGNVYYQPAASGPYHPSATQSHATPSPHQTTYQPHQSYHQSSSRSPRQPTSRIVCPAGHVQHLPSLVEHMVSTIQCSVCNASLGTPQADSRVDAEARNDEFEDEGFEEPQGSARLTYRRSTDMSTNTQAYVSKPIRVRKKLRDESNGVQ
ncbi:uncharacterized protein PV09_00759 [Verruconis gallopava]|uniref:Uncharacterized protein n=1 Tax=Verruconis gallopava TaxID=253628 RepID=A0A0D2BBS2_9PEZI|nr:uncharacterized protein PV09_00759 [Verruconis gallopava]KIW08829.1 hypothetical protein PV09_00759 [Verruconis gallopava]